MSDAIKTLSSAYSIRLLEGVLRVAFPGTKFYFNYSSVDVGWIGGPSANDVDAVTSTFAGEDFDGNPTMIEIKVDGKTFRTGLGLIRTAREVSD